MRRVLPDELRDFLYRHTPTVLELRTLLLIHGDPLTVWTSDRLVEALPELTPESAHDLLAAFYWQGFLGSDGARTFRYGPTSSDLARLTDQLAKVYAERSALVLAEVARLENLGDVRIFSDAFRFRGR